MQFRSTDIGISFGWNSLAFGIAEILGFALSGKLTIINKLFIFFKNNFTINLFKEKDMIIKYLNIKNYI